VIDAGPQAGDGIPDSFRMVRNGANLEIWVNSSLIFTAPLASAPMVTFRGSVDNDTFMIDYSGGNPIPGEGVIYDGLGGVDRLAMSGGSASAVTHTFSDMNSGMAEVDGATISYTNLEGISDGLSASNRTFLFGGGSDTLTIGDDGVANNNMSRISSAASSVAVNFLNPMHSLSLNAGEGNDRINVGAIEGGAGIPFAMVIDGGAGDDYVDGSGTNINLTGTGGTGNDALLGGSGNDLLAGGEGNDLIGGGVGNDVISGDAGTDLLFGGDGNDVIAGGEGNDTLEGGNGSDTLEGGNGNDLLAGGTGNDALRGGPGNDILLGGAGDDLLDGGGGNDFIFDFQGRNRIVRGSSSNTTALQGTPGGNGTAAGSSLVDLSGQGGSFSTTENGQTVSVPSSSWVSDFLMDLASRNGRNPNSDIQIILAPPTSQTRNLFIRWR
jgi:Ca2+-binding RTX toxin-like protein